MADTEEELIFNFCLVWDSELGRLGFDSPHDSHCVIEACGMCKVTVTSGGLVH